jgi:hypothetical protein
MGGVDTERLDESAGLCAKTSNWRAIGSRSEPDTALTA